MSRQYDNRGRDQYNIEKAGTVYLGGTSAQQKVEVSLKGAIAPKHQPQKWVNRSQPQAELLRRLETRSCLVEIVAQGGFGKTDLAAWLFAEKKGEFERSRWVDGSRLESFHQFGRWVLQEIGYLVPQQWDDEEVLHCLVQRLTERRCLLVVDQVERLPESAIALFDQFLQYWQERGDQSVVLVTTRQSRVTEEPYRFELAGLTESEGESFLTGQSAIAEGVENGLQRLVQMAEGHPYLLKLAASWVRQEANGTLDAAGLVFFERLFRSYQGDLEAKVEEVFSEVFSELPERLRSLLMSVVVYRDPFGLEMAQAMMADTSIEDLQFLTERAFLLEESERWTLHPLMKGLVERELKKSDRLREAHQKAIAYFAANLQPWTGLLSDCTEKLEIFHHRCELGEYALAHQIMETCIDSLCQRGYYRDLLPIYEKLTQTWTDANPNNAEEQRNLGWAWTLLGILYLNLGQYQAAISAHEQAQLLFNEIDYLRGKAASLVGLGAAYDSLGQYQQAINFHQQSLEVERNIGDRQGEANSLFNKARALAKYEPRRFEALSTLQQARDIYVKLKLDHEIERCDSEIYAFNQIIATEQLQSAPAIPSKAKSRIPSNHKINWIFLFCVGSAIAIVLLIAWLRK